MTRLFGPFRSDREREQKLLEVKYAALLHRVTGLANAALALRADLRGLSRLEALARQAIEETRDAD